MEELVKETIKDFVEQCASSEPTPGGGSVAALAAALAAALGQMVISLTRDKKAFAEMDAELRQRIEGSALVLGRLQDRLLEFVDEDTAAFKGFMKALKMSKDSEEAKAKRKSALNEASIHAMTVPLGTAKASVEVMLHLPDIARYGNKSAVTDAGVASLLARAATEAALFNVRTNLSSIDNMSICEDARAQCDSLLKEAERLNQEAVALVYERLS